MMAKPDWWQYATFDEDGFLTGIREDAPETAKAEYAEWKKTPNRVLKFEQVQSRLKYGGFIFCLSPQIQDIGQRISEVVHERCFPALHSRP